MNKSVAQATRPAGKQGLAGHQVPSPSPTVQAHLDVGLLLYPVDVLMQAVHQEGQKLLAVMLLVAAELWSKLRQLGLEGARLDTANTRLHAGSHQAGRDG